MQISVTLCACAGSPKKEEKGADTCHIVGIHSIPKKRKKDADKSSILKREKDADTGQERNIL